MPYTAPCSNFLAVFRQRHILCLPQLLRNRVLRRRGASFVDGLGRAINRIRLGGFLRKDGGRYTRQNLGEFGGLAGSFCCLFATKGLAGRFCFLSATGGGLVELSSGVPRGLCKRGAWRWVVDSDQSSELPPCEVTTRSTELCGHCEGTIGSDGKKLTS